MSNEQPSRSPRAGGASGASPMGSTLAIIVAVVAVIAGFLILRSIRSDDGGSSAPETTAAVTTIPTETSPPAVTEPPTTDPNTFTGTSVQVANASNQNGVAGLLTTALQGAGFTTVEPANSSTKLEATKILFDPAIASAEAVANTVAFIMGGVPTVEAITGLPIEGVGSLPADTGVLVLLGNDLAGKTLAQMQTAVTTESTPSVTEVSTATS